MNMEYLFFCVCVCVAPVGKWYRHSSYFRWSPVKSLPFWWASPRQWTWSIRIVQAGKGSCMELCFLLISMLYACLFHIRYRLLYAELYSSRTNQLFTHPLSFTPSFLINFLFSVFSRILFQVNYSDPITGVRNYRFEHFASPLDPRDKKILEMLIFLDASICIVSTLFEALQSLSIELAVNLSRDGTSNTLYFDSNRFDTSWSTGYRADMPEFVFWVPTTSVVEFFFRFRFYFPSLCLFLSSGFL